MRGIPVWSHTYGTTGPSVEAGVDFIIHGFEIDEDSMEKMYKKGIYFCPTINFLPAWLATYPPQYIPGVHDKYEGATLVDIELARLYDNVNKAYKMGVIITTGSDSFNLDSTPYGITTIGEIHRFVDCCGMSEMDAISAYLRKRVGNYEHSYNAQVLAQEIITDLLAEGLITYGGYEFKKQQKDHHSI